MLKTTEGYGLKGDKMQRVLVPLFTFFWWNRLWEDSNLGHMYSKRMCVVKVKGWNTALVDSLHGRITIHFCLFWERNDNERH